MKRISVLTTLFVSLLISFSLGCDSGGAKPGPSTSSSTATAVASTSEPAPAPLPKLDRPPDLPMNEVVKTSAGGLTTKVRAILRTLTPTDDLPVALVWQRVKPDRKDPLGKQGFDFYKTSESFRIKVRPPKGKWQSFTVKPQTASRHKITYPVAVGMVFRIDGHGVGLARGRIKLAWNKPDPKLFSQPGKYSIVVAGSIALAKKAISFESGEFTIEVVAASDEFKSIEALEALAAKDLAARRRLKKNPEPRKETIGDSQGFRLVRFSLDPKKAKAPSYNVDFVEVVISPNGKVLSIDERTIFTCIAADTRIETLAGPRPVQQLRVGDQLWGYDLKSQKRIPTTVRQIAASHATRLVVIGDNLRTTRMHPIYASGRWQRASQLVTDDELLSFDGRSKAVPTINTVNEFSPVFDLAVDWPHTYFAGGYLVHNKAVATPAQRAANTDNWTTVGARPGNLK